MEVKNKSRQRVTDLFVKIQGGFLESAEAEGRESGIAECTELLKTFCEPGEHRYSEEFMPLAVVFTRAAGALYAKQIENFTAVKEAAAKFHEAVKSVEDIPFKARVEFLALEKVLNGSVPDLESSKSEGGGGQVRRAQPAKRPSMKPLYEIFKDKTTGQRDGETKGPVGVGQTAGAIEKDGSDGQD